MDGGMTTKILVISVIRVNTLHAMGAWVDDSHNRRNNNQYALHSLFKQNTVKYLKVLSMQTCIRQHAYCSSPPCWCLEEER